MEDVEMTRHMSFMEWAIALSIVPGSVLLGWIVETVIISRLKKISRRTSWEGDDIIISAFGRMPELWCAFAGIYAVIYYVSLKPELFNVVHRILLVLIIFSVTVVLARISVRFVNMVARRGEGILPSTSIFANITKALVLVIGFLIILQSLGISIAPILTALGVGGLAVALALQDTLSNLFAGLQIIVSRQIKPGDYVRLDSGDEGYVADITWRTTTIKSLRNSVTIIPNAKLSSAVITNFSLPEKDISMSIQAGVAYDSDLDKVERVTLDVARGVLRDIDGGVAGFEPALRFYNFGESSIDLRVILRVREFADQYLVQHECIKRLQKRYADEGIVIPYPVRIVKMVKSAE